MAVNLNSAQSINPTSTTSVGATSLTGLQFSGLIITGVVLLIMFIYIVMLFYKMPATDSMNTASLDSLARNINSDTTDSMFSRKLQLLQYYQGRIKDSRDFLKEMSQMVLLNILFPTLTAILGYVFGKREE
jgi:hypothetical protein